MQTQIGESLNSSMKSHNATDVQPELNSTTAWDLTPFLETGSLTTFGILGIVMSVFVFVMYGHKRSLRTSANTYVLSLTTSDFLRCVFLLPFYVIVFKRSISGELWCKCLNFFSLWINLASVLSILLIAIDRNCAVKDPLHYVRNNSKKRAGVFVICVWIVSLFLAFPILLGFPEFDYDTCDIKVSPTGSIFDAVVMYESIITFTAFVVPLSSVTFLYYGMYKAAQNNIARDERNSCSSYGSSDVIVNIKSPRSSDDSEYSLRRHFYIREGENSREKNRFLKKHRAAVTGLLAVMSFIISWSPYFIVRFYQQFRVVTIQMKFWVHIPTFISSIVDPYIYFYRNRSTWIYTKKMAARVFHRKKSSVYYPTNIRSKIVSISNLYHTSACISQTVAASQSMEKRNFIHFSKTGPNGKVQIILYGQNSLQSKDDSQPSVTRKQFFHQDSSSSNSSSDLCPTTASSDSGETMHYQSLKQKYSEESSSEEKH